MVLKIQALAGMIFFIKTIFASYPVPFIKNTFAGSKKYYFSWGYNRDWYSKSDLNLRMGLGNEKKNQKDFFNLTVHDAIAKDRPDFDKILSLKSFTVPQFNARLGIIFDKSKWGIEICYDHAKYVVQDYQQVRVTGNLHGKEIDTSMVLDPVQFLHLEHTDGANFWMVNITKSVNLSPMRSFFNIQNMSKIGFGTLLPRTDVTFLGVRRDNNFHIAGYVAGFENAVQLNAGKHLYAEISGKYAFAYYTNALINKENETYVTHKFHTLMAFLNLGYRF